MNRIELTEEERAILIMYLNVHWKYIARDGDGELYAYKNRPEKDEESGMWFCNGDVIYNIIKSEKSFSNLFSFITWDDDEPYSIEDLLKGNE